MICLTGDVHHMGMKSEEQKFINQPEIELAEKYSKIAKNHNLKTNLFITGKCMENNPEIIQSIIDLNNVEIGGHTYTALKPSWMHRLFGVIFESTYGPRVYQKYDIRKTLNVLRKLTKQNILSWRTHGYASDANTYEVLKEEGVKIISEKVVPEKVIGPEINSGMVSLPINVLRDHGHIFHGFRTKKVVRRREKVGDSFNRKSYSVSKWFSIVKNQIIKIISQGGIATLQVHPICMKVADNFNTFKKLCKWISKKDYNTIFCREAVDFVRGE